MACLSSGGGKPTYSVLSKRPGRRTAGSRISEPEQTKSYQVALEKTKMCAKWFAGSFTWPVGGSHDENLAACLQPVHLGQQLVHHTHTGSRLNTRIKRIQSRPQSAEEVFNQHPHCYTDDFRNEEFTVNLFTVKFTVIQKSFKNVSITNYLEKKKQ